MDDKLLADRRGLLSEVLCLCFVQQDMDFVVGSPEDRRRFFDQTLVLSDLSFLDSLRELPPGAEGAQPLSQGQPGRPSGRLRRAARRPRASSCRQRRAALVSEFDAAVRLPSLARSPARTRTCASATAPPGKGCARRTR